MKLILTALLFSVTSAFATETVVFDIAKKEIKGNTQVSAEFTADADKGSAGVRVEFTSTFHRGPRQRTVRTTKAKTVTVEDMYLQDNKVMIGNVECGTYKEKTVVGMVFKTIKLSGRCDLDTRTVKDTEGKKHLQVVLSVK